MLDELNRTSVDIPMGMTLPDLFRMQVDRTPDAIAVVCGDDQITFLDLYTRAQTLAAQLADIGVTTGSVVGVALTRNISLIVALVAIHEVGAAYLPLDPAYPADRLSYLVDDSKASLVLVDKLTAPVLPSLQTKIAQIEELSAPRKQRIATRRVRSDDLAYVLYTSGSTGHPKGVGVEHRNVVNLIFCLRTLIQDEDLKGVLFSTSLNFDISVYEIFLPLIFGGRMIMVDNLLYLPSIAARDEVRLINTGPSLMAALITLGWTPGTIRTINLAGEPLPRRLGRDDLQSQSEGGAFQPLRPNRNDRLFNLRTCSEVRRAAARDWKAAMEYASLCVGSARRAAAEGGHRRTLYRWRRCFTWLPRTSSFDARSIHCQSLRRRDLSTRREISSGGAQITNLSTWDATTARSKFTGNASNSEK